MAAAWQWALAPAAARTLELGLSSVSLSTAADNWRPFGQDEFYSSPKPHGRFAIDGVSNDAGLTQAADETAPALWLAAGDTIDRRIRFEAKDLAVDYGTLEISLDAVSQAAADTLAADRLLMAGGFEEDAVSAVVAGWKLQLFERFTLGSRIALTDRRSDSSTAFRRAGDLATAAQGAAMWNDFTATIVDNADLRWSLAAQLGVVDSDYRAATGARPRGAPAIAGTRTYVMTRIGADGISLSAATQRIDGPSRDLETRRATLDMGGAQLTLYGSDSADAIAATDTVGVTAELFGDDLIPAALSDLKAWAPTLLSLSVERHKTTELGPDAGTPMRGPTITAEAAWNTGWGQTSFSYWRSDTTTRMQSALEAGRFIDVSHLFTLGDWKTSIGASYDTFLTAGAGARTEDSGLSGHASFSYAAKDQPELRFGIDRRQDESLLEEHLGLWRSSALDLFFSLDAASWLKAELGIAATRAGLEYRRQIRGEGGIGGEEATPAVTEALVASFAAPL